MNMNSQLVNYQLSMSITQVHPSSLLCTTPFILYTIPPSRMLHLHLLFFTPFLPLACYILFYYSNLYINLLLHAQPSTPHLQASNIGELICNQWRQFHQIQLGEARVLQKEDWATSWVLNNAKQNWEYSEVLVLIKCKEVEYTT